MKDLKTQVQEIADRAKVASKQLALATGEQKSAWLKRSAEKLRSEASSLKEANKKDLQHATETGLTSASIDRLRLTDARIESMAEGLEQIILLPDPVGRVIDSSVRPNGLRLLKTRVPLGVVFFIYESRPNVTVDAGALCVKSGNAVILRGGKEAIHSNRALHQLLSSCLKETGLPVDAVQLVQTTDRDAVGYFLQQSQSIDVTIPRGGRSLIERVAKEATMPVIKHFDGICHVYIDQDVNMNIAEEIVVNSKHQRPGVCNALETLLVHTEIADLFLSQISETMTDLGVELRCCERSLPLVTGGKLLTEEDYSTEYLDLILTVKIVDNIQEAVDHIEHYGSHHTDCIVTNNLQASEEFVAKVDSAAVIVNASTRFNDGFEFGLGAEIGISTDKFHARGPCGLEELTSYKYVVHGTGQIRS